LKVIPDESPLAFLCDPSYPAYFSDSGKTLCTEEGLSSLFANPVSIKTAWILIIAKFFSVIDLSIIAGVSLMRLAAKLR
jgi:hypothetical protein